MLSFPSVRRVSFLSILRCLALGGFSGLLGAQNAVREPDRGSQRVLFIDLTGNGRLDLLCLGAEDATDSLVVRLNQGPRQFLEVPQTLPRVAVRSVLATDLDRDGWTDLYLVSGAANVALLGDGTGAFREATETLGLVDAGSGLAAERRDVDEDGLLDLVLHNAEGDVLFWAESNGAFSRWRETPLSLDTSPNGPGAPVQLATIGIDASNPRPGFHALPGGPSGSQPLSSLPPPYDDRYVNDDMNEVDSADVVDGSLTGADVSTSTGNVTHTGGNLGIGTATPTARLDVAGDVAVGGAIVVNALGQWVGDPTGLQGPPGADGAPGSNGANGANGTDGPHTGGINNTYSPPAFIGGGQDNAASGARSTIAGGASNQATGNHSAIGGGLTNTAGGTKATVAGGTLNSASSLESAIGGGNNNSASGDHATIGGGIDNLASSLETTVSGGENNTASGSHATVGGGDSNLADKTNATVGGGASNTASGSHATVAGGIGNVASGSSSSVAGGQNNTASGAAAVAGGLGATAGPGDHTTVAGGENNTASGIHATVGGGLSNLAGNTNATVGGGASNSASGIHATVAGGIGNIASGNSSFVAGGNSNASVGLQSFAAGLRAKANHNGSFVWGDGASVDKPSTAVNSFDVYASGGIFLHDDLDVDGQVKSKTLLLTGGADIVEGFVSSGAPLAAGTVVVIDPDRAGTLRASSQAYDTRVAGVVSGANGVNPGLHLSQAGRLEGDTPVAMAGRVYVRCSAEGGAIRPGDLLTTAATPGHAMRAGDAGRRPGAVIGKAMSGLESGTGLVLVLVNLQ